MNGRLPSARMDSFSTHLDSCDACRAELEDLRTFKSSAAGLSQSGSLGRELDRRKRQRQLKAAGNAAIVAAVVAAIAAVGWWKFGKARVQGPSVVATRTGVSMPDVGAAPGAVAGPAAPVAQSHTVPVVQPHVSAPAATVAQAPASAVQPRTAPAAQPRDATTPTVASQPAGTSFALLGPFGDEIADARPEFTWQPLAGATKYSVVIVDEGLRPVQHSHGVKTTSWRPRRPLRRGRTYLWQVTATLRNGTKIVATGPTSLEARIHIAQTPSGKLADNRAR